MKPGAHPISDDPHRKVEIGLRLALARLKEADTESKPLDTETSHLIGQLIFAVGAAHEAWKKKFRCELSKTVIQWREKNWEV